MSNIVAKLTGSYKKQGRIGKILFIAFGILVFCCVCSVPIALLNPTTPTSAVNNSTIPEAVASSTEVQIEIPTNTPVPEAVVSPTEVQTEIPTNTPVPSATPEPLEQLKNSIADALGTSNRDVVRLSHFGWNSEQSEIEVTVAANDNLTDNLLKYGFQMDIVDVLRTIQTSNTPLPYDSVVVAITFPLVDVYGNSKESNVVIATYSRENLDKVNWVNFLTDNVYLIANQDSLYIHPAARP